MSLWFRIIGILSTCIAVYFFYYGDDQKIALIFGVLASLSLSLSWIFNAVR